MSGSSDDVTAPTAGSTSVLLDRSTDADADEVLEVTFAVGLPGFDQLRAFVIEPMAGDLAPFCRLRATDPTGVEFIVVSPGVLFPDYQVEVDEETVERLDLRAEDAAVLSIVTLSDDGSAPTANLLGPIVVNRRNGAAAQVVLHGTEYQVAAPLVPPASASV
jgi:flagellar assembly factor FliW